jgi:erythromycin esterase-like protein
MVATNAARLLDELPQIVRPIRSPQDVMEPILEMIGDARIVMIGEASHGTHDFYDYRAQITKRLIEERGFTAVCAEADWPDAWRVNRFVRGFGDDANAAEALAGFKRFPQWMWRNTVVLEFVNWLRRRNGQLSARAAKAGFYGIDLYSLNASVHAVLEFLDKVDPAAAARARYRYSCFEDFGEDPQAYGYAASFDLDRSCEDQAIAQLIELRRNAANYARRDPGVAEDESFYAEQNARVIANAERYYRTMFTNDVSSWNLRDSHMADTIDALLDHFDRRNPAARTKVVVWAHNSHLGDARATVMGWARSEWNVGQLMRERHGRDVCNIGFSTYRGTVTAASTWDAPAETKRVCPGLPNSYERLFHETEIPDFLLRMTDAGDAHDALRREHLQRAIGVIYRPQTERISHYFDARLPDQFDAMIHLDQTSALIPLDQRPEIEAPVVEEETYPFGV